MAIFGNKEILIDIDELPKINGFAINSIYKCIHNLSGIKGAYPDKENIFVYYTCYPYFYSVDPKRYPLQRIEKLPKELAILFDNSQVAEYKYNDKPVKTQVIINSINYRTSCSGNGSFIDDSIYASGVNLINRSDSISVTRGTNRKINEVGQLLLNTLNISYDCPLLKEWQYTYYPTTTLRRVDNLNYPDPECSGWRRDTKMPYVSLDNRKSLRVLNENIKAHVYLLKVEESEIEIGAEYVGVKFSYRYDEEPDKYCFIRSWAHFKEDSPNQMIHFKVEKINNKNQYAECTVMQGGHNYKKDNVYFDELYRIVRIKNSNEL